MGRISRDPYSAGNPGMINIPEMRESTSDVIHNLKNVINPVLWDHVYLRQHYSSIRVDLMRKAFDELSTNQLPPRRRQELQKYLALTLDHIEFVQNGVDQRLDEMERRTRNVIRLLEEQSTANSSAQSNKSLNLEDLINDALSLTSTKGDELADISIDLSIPKQINFSGNRVTMLHLISNLIINAYKAILKAGNHPGKISICAAENIVANRKTIHVQICDNGGGIAPKNLERIFERGYSTKSNKSGIGLHWCAKVLRSLNGKIYARSKGLGHGACLHVHIPQDNASLDNRP